jgi:hypothetical protein
MIKKLLVILLTISLVLPISSLSISNQSLNNINIVSEVDAATSLTINKADTSTAKKLDTQLKKKKAITLKVKGNKRKSKKLLTSLITKLKKVNKLGVKLNYKVSKKSGNYYLYTVSAENAKLYTYSCSFVSKLYKNLKNKIKKSDAYTNYKKYPNDTTRHYRMIYDQLINYFVYDYSYEYIDEQGKEVSIPMCTGYDKQTTKGSINFQSDISQYEKYIINKEVEKGYISYHYNSEGELTPDNYDYSYDYETDTVTITPLPSTTLTQTIFKSFNEFVNDGSAKKMLNQVKSYYDDISSQDKLVLNKNFCDLSAAMKIWVIDASAYFSIYYSNYVMKYTGQYTAKGYGSAGMKRLLDNKAQGVCQDFAEYEQLLFNQLSITNYIRTNFNINHAWTVVKVKNSKGKTLWIPFDYGIGPSETLSVSKTIRNKYLKTEAMRYKLYLKGIKGAPSKKNFKTSDFN